MRMRTPLANVPRLAALALLVAFSGCASTRRIVTREDFAQLAPGRAIVVYARNDRIYRLERYALADSSIHGSGTLSEQGRSAPFDGDVSFAEIIAVETQSRSVVKALVVAGITAICVAEIVHESESHHGLNPTLGTSYHAPPATGGGGGSCPYVYAWDGTRFRLQAEPFGSALGRALELGTWHLLPAARADRGVVRLRLANEREETHYVNSIDLYAIELGAAPAAALDAEGGAWPLFRPIPPVRARDRSGLDITALLAAADDRSWECDPASLTAASGYEDVLELAFPRATGSRVGSLVLTGVNTTFSTMLYRSMRRCVGDETPALVHAIESDPLLIAELRDYARDASLAVSVWDGREWVPAGAFMPEANAVPFTRALRIGIPAGAGDTVRVRLRSMADAWRIDAISIDWDEARPLPMTRVELQSAAGPAGEDLRGELAADDDRYAVLLPPDRVDLAFAPAEPRAGSRIAYAIRARGYLMEWDPPALKHGSVAAASWSASDRRIGHLEAVLRDRNLALGPAYAEWRKLRAARADAN